MLQQQTARQRRGNQKLLLLIEQYQKAHPEEGDAINPHLIAPWLISHGLWFQEPLTPEEMLRRTIRRSLRDDYTHDPQGREVRKYHAVIEEVRTPDGIRRLSTWREIFEAPPDHMRVSLALRRKSALNDVAQLQMDFESYNENNKHNATLTPMDYNFNTDLAEGSMPTEYPDENPGDGEENDEEQV